MKLSELTVAALVLLAITIAVLVRAQPPLPRPADVPETINIAMGPVRIEHAAGQVITITAPTGSVSLQRGLTPADQVIVIDTRAAK